MSTLHIAAQYHTNQKVIQTLINKGAEANTVTRFFDTPLHLACRWNSSNDEVVKVLIENGANVNAKNNDKITPLHFAA